MLDAWYAGQQPFDHCSEQVTAFSQPAPGEIPGLRPAFPGQPVVTVDLDSTLCDTRHRQLMLPPPEQRKDYDWTSYSLLCANDSPIQGAVRLLELLAPTHEIIILSARTNKSLELTSAWLKEHLSIKPLAILLQEFEHFLGHAEYKPYRIQQLQRSGFDVRLHIDDWYEVETALEPLGVPTLVVFPPHLRDGDILVM